MDHGGVVVSNLNPARNRSIFRPDQGIFEQETKFKIGIKKDEVFLKILGAIDFTDCKTDLDAIRKFWNSVWPTLERVISDNEILLDEQKRTLIKYAEVMDDLKNLELKIKSLEEHFGDTDEWKSAFGKSLQETGKEEA